MSGSKKSPNSKGRIRLSYTIGPDYHRLFELSSGPFRVQIITEPPRHIRMRQNFDGSTDKLQSQILDWIQETMTRIEVEGAVPF